MKNLKFIIINLLICITFIPFHFSIIYKYKLNSFSEDDVVNNIEYLASDELEGRLCGSQGNLLAQDFILDNFKEINLLPYKEKYLHDFDTHFPKEIQGKPYLKIINSTGEVIKNYEYNRDFKDAFLNFNINTINFNTNSEVNVYPSALSVKDKNGKIALFIRSDMASFDFRSSFVYDAPFDLYTMVSNKTFDEMVAFYKKGYYIECFFPYEVVETKVNNIAGVIKGKNSTLPPLVLTAHFDHVGKDLDEKIYNGALDNASGVSFLMELASFLKSLPIPERDIIIVALNAEEFGLLGAKSFAKDNKEDLIDSKVINFDMIGSDKNIPLTLMTGQSDEDKKQLLDNLIHQCQKQNITHLVEAKDSSDHAGFLHENIDSVTINDGDISKIHTPNDKVEYISKSAINRAFSVVWPVIYNSAYSNSPLFLIDTRILTLLFFIFLLTVLLSISTNKD